MGIDEFVAKYGEALQKNIMTENCVSDFFDVILELNSAVRSELRQQIIRLYEHLLKYKYQPHKQSRSWINSIRDSSGVLYAYTTDRKSINYWNQYLIENDIENCYQTAINRAAAQTGLEKRKLPKEIEEEIIIPNILDSYSIERYLRKYAYSNEAKEVLDLI